jgi:hypothetical protein
VEYVDKYGDTFKIPTSPGGVDSALQLTVPALSIEEDNNTIKVTEFFVTAVAVILEIAGTTV